jgi:hypothetical protein
MRKSARLVGLTAGRPRLAVICVRQVVALVEVTDERLFCWLRKRSSSLGVERLA